MQTQNSVHVALQGALEHWTALAHDADPIVRAAARELLADLKRAPRPRQTTVDRQPTYWHRVIDQVIDTEPRYSKSASGYKTGHGYAHGSKSGTCVSVDTDLGLWYCSSCKRGGDTVRWVTELEQCDYAAAWNILTSRFGVDHAGRD